MEREDGQIYFTHNGKKQKLGFLLPLSSKEVNLVLCALTDCIQANLEFCTPENNDAIRALQDRIEEAKRSHLATRKQEDRTVLDEALNKLRSLKYGAIHDRVDHVAKVIEEIVRVIKEKKQ